MPKSRSAAVPRAAGTPRDSTEQKSPILVVRDAADAMFRGATECCHQHDRMARIELKAASEEEVQAARQACEHFRQVLHDQTRSYEQVAGAVRPGGEDEQWWHRANALWLASREYLRRNGGCDSASKDLKEHTPERLGELHAEYELEASALLALRQAADAYRKDRPTAA